PAGDAERLQGILAGLQAADRTPDLWPGFKASAFPLVLVDAERVAYLLHHPRPTAPFAPAAGLSGVALTHALDGLPRGLAFGVPLGDREGVVIPMTPLDDQNTLTAYHELFHAYQDQKAFYHGHSTDMSPRDAQDLGRAEAEHALLAAALQAATPEGRQAACRQFLALRALRQAGAGEDFVANEDGLEALEGTARYVEARVQIAAAGAPGVPASPAFMPEAALRQALVSELEAPLDPDTFRRRRYMLTGAAMGFLLDALAPGWKGEVEAGKRLVERLTEATGYRQQDAEALLAAAEEAVGIRARIEAAVDRMAAVEIERAAALAAFEQSPGRRVEVRVPAEYGGFGLSTYEQHAIADHVELFGPDTTLSLEHADLSLTLEGRLLLRELPAGYAFEFHAREASWLLDGGATPGAGTAEGALVLSAEGVTLRATRARVTVAGDRTIVELPPYSAVE
ncbi:MAG: hypothetical protein ACLGIN_11905, partial [Candidatus Sericytochromatia bacterium]